MRAFAALLLKEEMAIFTSPIAYVVMTVFLVIMGYNFTLTLFVSHAPTLVHIFFQIFVLLLLTVPIITMRLVAEERRLRTIEMLLAAPVSEVAVVLSGASNTPPPPGALLPKVSTWLKCTWAGA
jgi:ABC-2 type transport system permease protein